MTDSDGPSCCYEIEQQEIPDTKQKTGSQTRYFAVNEVKHI